MAEPGTLNYANHRKYVPGFHYVAVSLLTLYILWALYKIIFHFSVDALASLVLAVVVFLALFYGRIFPLGVQDRLIVLEQRARLAALLPPELAPRVVELRKGQMVALRFASDEEAAELVGRVFAGELKTADEIKKAIRVWKPDPLRI